LAYTNKTFSAFSHLDGLNLNHIKSGEQGNHGNQSGEQGNYGNQSGVHGNYGKQTGVHGNHGRQSRVLLP